MTTPFPTPSEGQTFATFSRALLALVEYSLASPMWDVEAGAALAPGHVS